MGSALEERWRMALTPEVKEKDERNRHQNRSGQRRGAIATQLSRVCRQDGPLPGCWGKSPLAQRVEVSKHSCRLCVRGTEAETDLQAIVRTH